MNRGDKYRPVVTVLKMKDGTPTVLSISGNVYVMQTKDGYVGKRKGKKHESKQTV